MKTNQVFFLLNMVKRHFFSNLFCTVIWWDLCDPAGYCFLQVLQGNTFQSRQRHPTNGWPCLWEKNSWKLPRDLVPIWDLISHMSFYCLCFFASCFPKPQITTHSHLLCECIYCVARSCFKFNEEKRKKNVSKHPRLFSSHKWMCGFPGNQMTALCFKTPNPLGRGRSVQTEQEAMLPSSSPASQHDWRACWEQVAWNLWLRTSVSKGWSLSPHPSSSSPSSSHSQPHLTLPTLLG